MIFPWQSSCAVLYTKPARPGKVKTRLIGELSAAQTAELHTAFLADVLHCLSRGRFQTRIAWALDSGEGRWDDSSMLAELGLPGVKSFRQSGADLGARLAAGLGRAASDFEYVMAVGSDHPELLTATVEDGFRRLAGEADVVLGPTADGGYYLIALAGRALRSELFEGIAWSTDKVLEQTVERCAARGLRVSLLPPGHDIDVADDLEALINRLGRAPGCDRTRALLTAWGRLPRPSPVEGTDAHSDR